MLLTSTFIAVTLNEFRLNLMKVDQRYTFLVTGHIKLLLQNSTFPSSSFINVKYLKLPLKSPTNIIHLHFKVINCGKFHLMKTVLGASNTLGTDRQMDRQSSNRKCPVFFFSKQACE